jgi:hypothetical protein
VKLPSVNNMKFTSLSLGIAAIATCSTFAALPAHRVSAQCVMNDISIGVAINGSSTPTNRQSRVTQNSNGGCVGNTVNTTGVQVQTGGTSPVTQTRTVNQTINGKNNSPTGVNLSPVKTRTNVGVDVYNPAAR